MGAEPEQNMFARGDPKMLRVGSDPTSGPAAGAPPFVHIDGRVLRVTIGHRAVRINAVTPHGAHSAGTGTSHSLSPAGTSWLPRYSTTPDRNCPPS